ncbi:MAG TPA: glycosyltransferase family 2 protein [Bacteroidia bacterium]|jgi:glycosyltransferase involved in cell wall biosynthesis|nr:glycosyltransferase family 2 protein [Bacteroidia bacterium]
MNPLISICIPSYNNADYITETISSVLNQTYQNFEIIIVDDCSKDNTVELIKSIADPRIKLVVNDTNLGMHGNWNKALSLGKGEYLKLLCGDDLIYPRCLELQLKEFEKKENQDVVMVACRRKVIRSDGKESLGALYKLRPGKYNGKSAVKYCVSFGTNLIGEPMSVLFKASVFRENNIVLGSNNYLIDLDMYFKLLKYGKLIVQNDYLAAFRIYNASMTSSLGLKHSKYFNEFISQKNMKADFGVKWYHLFIGRILAFNINIARNIILYLNK